MTDLSSGAPRLASAGARFRAAVAAEKPLQIAGTPFDCACYLGAA